MTLTNTLSALALAALLAGCAAPPPTGKTATVPAGVPAIESSIARQGYFFVGGRYVGEAGREVMIGQMYHVQRRFNGFWIASAQRTRPE